jgi:hypothetical protein
MGSSILARRSKVIFCRVSEQEFQDLQAWCVDLGLPSVSECLRIALQRLLASSASNSDDLLQGLTKKVDEALHLLQENSARQRAVGIQQGQAEESFFNTHEQKA